MILGSSSLFLLLTAQSLFSLTFAAKEESLEEQKLKHLESATVAWIADTFRTPKKIAFACYLGGSSHVYWVLSIAEELSMRGHSTFFFTKDDHKKFGKLFPSVETVSFGPGPDPEEGIEIQKTIRSAPLFETLSKMLTAVTKNFTQEYLAHYQFFESHQLDLVICDHFNTACVEAAIKLKIPFIVSSAAPQGPDTTAPYINSDVLTMRNPTTEHMSLYHRLHDMLIKPILAYLALRDHIQQQKKILKSLNIEAYLVPGSSWKDSIKIVNSAFGFDRARPMGPLVEMIGPILPNKFAVLTPEIAQFLDNHKRVAYVAFGQHTIFNQRDVELVMTGLLEAYEANEIDGIVWATNGAKDPFTIQLSTSSSSTYDMNDLNSGKHPHVVLLDWAPQMAILNHSSTIMFISHGGIGSVHEACYAGVRLVIYPFFGDQPAIAVNVENSGIGLKLDYRGEVKDAVDIIRRVANNKDDMQANVNRFKALVQIRAKHGVFRGADIAEEVLFMNVGGKMYHRYDVKRNMSFIKANNIDIYAIILVAFSITVYTLVAFFRYTRFFSKTETKLKSSLIRSKVQAGPGSN